MGYCSTLVSQYYDCDLPEWFSEKYKEKIQVFKGSLIASKKEFKIYDDELFLDYQKALNECNLLGCIPYVTVNVLGECDETSLVKIYHDRIEYSLVMECLDSDFIFLP